MKKMTRDYYYDMSRCGGLSFTGGWSYKDYDLCA